MCTFFGGALYDFHAVLGNVFFFSLFGVWLEVLLMLMDIWLLFLFSSFFLSL